MPEGRIPIYKPYGCVPLILKGNGFSVPVVYPTQHLTEYSPPHTLEDIHQTPLILCTSAVILGLQLQPDDLIFMTSSVKMR